VTLTNTGAALPQMKLIAAGGGQVATGSRHLSQGGHTLAVTTGDEVYAWGDNFHGQLGKDQSSIQRYHDC
jgi:alpha-tubulin suppressor-like RCC1 family protein